MSSGEQEHSQAALLTAPLGVQRIFPLSAEAIAQIHSSKNVTSLTSAILCLLENSLDAGATKIEISADWKRGGCTIDDNGVGIPPAEFDPSGSLGKMYCTSKQSSSGSHQVSSLHGSTGTFLAELAAMSLLSITSTHQTGESAASLTLHHGKVIARSTEGVQISGFSALPQRRGTSIAVRDLFGNMPVRVKQRALAAENGNDESKEWLELKREIVALLLAWPHPCVVKLSEANSNMKTVNLAASHPSVGGALTEKSLKGLAGKRSKYDIRDVLPILFQAGFAPQETRSRWIPLSATASDVRLRGIICLDPAPSKQSQFIAIGITPCSRVDEHNELYHAVNKIFANSDFGLLDAGNPTGNPQYKGKGEGYTRESTKAQKGIDRYGMYFIQLNFSQHLGDSGIRPERLGDDALRTLVEVLQAAVNAWLDNHHFRPTKRRKRRNQDQHTPSASSHGDSRSRSAVSDHGISLHDSGVIFPRTHHAQGNENCDQRRNLNQGSGIDSSGLGNTKLQTDHTMLSHVSGIKFGRSRHQGQPRKVEKGSRSSTSGVEDFVSLGHGSDQSAAAERQTRIRAPGIEAEQYNRAHNMEYRAPRSHRGSKSSRPLEHSDDFGEVDETDLLAAAEATMVDDYHNAAGGEDGVVTWTDPITKELFRVNSRTGVVLPMRNDNRNQSSNPGTETGHRQRAAIDMALSSAGKPISLARRNALTKGRPPSASTDRPTWLPGFLKEWNNPVFVQRQEEQIPVVSFNGPGLLEIDEAGKCCSRDQHHIQAFAIKDDCSDPGTKLSKETLKRSRVIAQVDQKYILVKSQDGTDAYNAGLVDGELSLVLIDQHAASERIILEKLLDELCVADLPEGNSGHSTSLFNSTPLTNTIRNKPLIFEVSRREQELFARHRSYFAAWGIQYHLEDPSSGSAESHAKQTANRLIVTALPTAIVERCANTPSLTIELLRSEVWAIADGSKKAILPNSTDNDATPRWLQWLPNMPTHMLQMLHSRACRSAVMFNDPLTIAACQDLVDELAKCVFPFICAHGRVSMVPILRLGKGGREGFRGFDVGKAFLKTGERDEDIDGEQRVSASALKKFMSKLN